MNIGGLDTETPLGNLALICTDDGYIETDNIDDTLEFLLTGKQKQSKIYFTFNLRFDAQSIIKQIPSKLWKPLWEDNECHYEDYNIFYIPKKLLSISKLRNKHQTKLYDIAQFYKGYNLDRAAKEFLGNDGKNKDISAEQIGESRKYYDDNLEKIIEYSIKDAELTKALGLLTKEKFEKFNVDFSNPISPASLSGNFVFSKYFYPRSPEDLKLGKLHQIARSSFRGGFFQTFMRGYFDQPLWDLDLNSAYPSNMIKLPHWGNGTFVMVQDYNELDSDFGWIFAEFDCEYIPYNTFRPISFSPDDLLKDDKKGMWATASRIIYPSGKRIQVITKLEYDWMKKHNFPVKFIGAVYWVQRDNKHISPFAWMKDFYYERLRIKKLDFALQWSMKIFMNGLYGKTAQYRHGIGKLTNFFYASYITAMTRMQVAEVVFNNKKSIVNIATDGLLSLKPLDVELGTALGTWEQKEYEKGLVVGNGILQLWSKDGSFKTKARGITENMKWDMMQAIEKEKHSDVIEFSKKAPVQLGEIMMQKLKYVPSDLNRFVTKTKRMRVGCDESNKWDYDYINYDELLNKKTFAKPLQIENIKPRKI